MSIASERAARHAKALAELKASVLVPVLQREQSRQAAELAAKHQAELDLLMK